jgi:hypothetical protein
MVSVILVELLEFDQGQNQGEENRGLDDEGNEPDQDGGDTHRIIFQPNRQK